MATLTCEAHAREDVRRRRIIAFDQDLVEPIERQARQDGDDAPTRATATPGAHVTTPVR